jgi:hypothetical protein
MRRPRRCKGRFVTERIAWIFWMAYQELRSFHKVGEALGFSQGTVHTALRDHGYIKVAPGHRHRLPEEVVEAIAADYRRLKSVAKVADRCGRTPQAVWEILHRRGLTLPPKPGGKKYEYKGEYFTSGKNGYLRSTKYSTRFAGKSRLLHRVIWEDHFGPIPKDHILLFRDENRENCDISNLECVTRAEHRRRMTQNKQCKNAWGVFREVHDHLFSEWQNAIAEGKPEEEIEKARKRYESLERPNVWNDERRRKHTEFMRKRWDRIAPEAKEAFFRKIVESRRRRREAQFGSVVDVLLEGAA